MSDKNYSATDSKFKKALRMLQTQGLSSTVKKVKDYSKIHKKVDYNQWMTAKKPQPAELREQVKSICSFKRQDVFSIVTKYYGNSSISDFIKSLIAQSYDNFELLIVCAEKDKPDLDEHLSYYGIEDDRIKIFTNEIDLNGSDISGHWIISTDSYDELEPDALYRIEEYLNANENNNVMIFYSDEDQINNMGTYSNPYFKPDFNLDLLRSCDYFGNLLAIRRSLIYNLYLDDNEMTLAKFTAVSRYGYILRLIEEIMSIYNVKYMPDLDAYIKHIPRVLYHRNTEEAIKVRGAYSKSNRIVYDPNKNKASEISDEVKNEFKRYLSTNVEMLGIMRKSLKEHYKRLKIAAEVMVDEEGGCLRTEYDYNCDVHSMPLVSIIIPNKDHSKELDRCLKSIYKQSYDNLEILIVENNSEDWDIFDYYKSLEKTYGIKDETQDSKGFGARISNYESPNPKISGRVIRWSADDGEFNYSAINNFAAKEANGDYLLFLNNDTEMMDESCISELLSFTMRDEVGITGARMYFPNGSIQHAGVFVGYEGRAGHLFCAMPENDAIYLRKSRMAQDYSAVTGACMMVKRDVYDKIWGFDEKLAVNLNDIDFCLKARKLGYIVAYNPYAKLLHDESLSRGVDDTPEKIERFEYEVNLFRERHKSILEKGDPYYNKNLSLVKADCSLDADYANNIFMSNI